jgi:hypothetical protein
MSSGGSARMRRLLVEVRSYYDSIPESKRVRIIGHDIDHVERVVENAQAIINPAKPIPAGSGIELTAAALCHDIAYIEGERGHERRSAVKARSLLSKCGFNDDEISRIQLLIRRHGRQPAHDYCGKILYLADKLDMFGYDGVARALMYLSKTMSNRDKIIDLIWAQAFSRLRRYEALGIGRKLISKKRRETEHLLTLLRRSRPRVTV